VSVREYPQHALGEPCPVIDLLETQFGEQYGGYLLWNFTCFPYDDVTAYEQARALVAAERVGLFNEYLRSQENELDKSMWSAAFETGEQARDYFMEGVKPW
jgi:hypothetical protein